VSLRSLFNNQREIKGISDITIEKMADLVVRGGWPSTIGKKQKIARR